MGGRGNEVPYGSAKDSQKSQSRNKRELLRVRSSITFELATLFIKAIERPWRLLWLPISIIRLAIISFRRSPNERDAIKFSENSLADSSRRECVVFFPTNGVGLGHFTRTLAVARKMKKAKPDLEIVFFTTMPALHILKNEGFPAYHVPGRKMFEDMGSNVWNSIADDLLKTRLVESCDKPDGVEIVMKKVDFNHGETWDADDVRSKRWSLGDDAMNGDVLNWYFLFPAGKYSDSSVLGVAVDASTVALFKDSIEESENLIRRPSAEEIERAVTIHEAGHLLGLVNLVYQSPVDHEDPDHPGHSSNSESVMYWAIESAEVSNVLSGSLPDEFDSDDKADMSGMADGSIEVTSQVWR